MTASDALRGLSRRDLLRLTGRHGLTSVLLGAATLTGAATLADVARAAETTRARRLSGPARHRLRLGASGFNAASLLIERAGTLTFIQDLESRTDGAIRVEFIGDNEVCSQETCVEKTQSGVIDMFTASTQNSARVAPYLNVLDYPYVFPGRASQYHFLYSPVSQAVLRDPLERRHGLKFLFSHCELRGLQMGASFADRPTVTRLEEVLGTRNRVTDTQLGRIAMQLLDLGPVPMRWDETQDALRKGQIDGAETWASAMAYSGMAPLVSQSVDLRFLCGTEHTAMLASRFDALEGELQDAVMESAYLAQVHVQAANEAALVKTVGYSDPPLPDTILAREGVRTAFLPPDQIRIAEEMCAPEFNPAPWMEWRARLEDWANGVDTYATIHRVAREVAADMKPENVPPRRWWKS